MLNQYAEQAWGSWQTTPSVIGGDSSHIYLDSCCSCNIGVDSDLSENRSSLDVRKTYDHSHKERNLASRLHRYDQLLGILALSRHSRSTYSHKHLGVPRAVLSDAYGCPFFAVVDHVFYMSDTSLDWLDDNLCGISVDREDISDFVHLSTIEASCYHPNQLYTLCILGGLRGQPAPR